MDKLIKKAQISNDIRYVKEKIEYHRRMIHQLQATGMGLTDELNKLKKGITIKMSFPVMTENMEMKDA